ncbi:MAG: relaxase/mobilization nuclease domain-containing protein [Rhizomicrobium sp.]
MEAYAEGTKCEKPLYHAMVCPQPGYPLTRAQFMEALDVTEEALGLKGQARVVVAHEKDGEEHWHVAWARIDLKTMKAIPDSHNFPKHEKAARELERRFGHPHVQGAHAERENVERPDRSLTRAELRQEGVTGIKGKDVRQEITELFRSSDGAEAFKAALEDHGYVLAKGDRRDFVIIDRAGGDHSLARRISGIKAAELREFMAPIDRNSLPTVDQAVGIVQDRLHGTSAFDAQCWEDALAASAIEKEVAADQSREQNIRDAAQNDRDHDAADAASRKWEDDLSASAIGQAEEERERRKQEAREAKTEARIKLGYADGQDYVTQTEAALKDHTWRQDAVINEEPRPQRPSDLSEDEQRIARLLDEDHRDRHRAEETSEGTTARERTREASIASKFDNVEMTEAQQRKMQRLLDSGGSERDDDLEPDKQREVPGGGRTRSQ